MLNDTIYAMKVGQKIQAFGSRALILFIFGLCCAITLHLQQLQRNALHPGSYARFSQSTWLITPFSASGAVIIGLTYPWVDGCLDKPHSFKREWSSVLRCFAIFMGINYASVKINFVNSFQLSLTIAAMSFGMWWLFDRSMNGLMLGLTIAFFGTFITQILGHYEFYQLTQPDFFYVRSWLPGIIFAGGTTFGSIGRQLAMSKN